MESNLKFRRAVPADAGPIRSLTRLAYAKWVPLIGREPLPMTADYARAVVEHLIDLLEADGELVGLVEMVAKSDHLLIENLAVEPSRQGRNLGRMLLDHVEETANALKLPEVQLYTNILFDANIRFYARNGYSEFRRAELVPGSVAVFMKKSISVQHQ